MNNIPYTYTVVESHPESLMLRYESPGKQWMDIGVPQPLVGQTLDEVAAAYAPIQVWAAQNVQRQQIPVGTTGSRTVEPVTLDTLKREKLAALAAWRYDREIGGITVAGARIDTDRQSQATITGTLVAMRENLTAAVDWKTANGAFVTLTLPQIAAVAAAVVAHVQACFTAESLLAAEINACQTAEELAAIEFPDEVVA